jgi:Mn2+/Fe2+ NRAMP family transporter
MCAGGKISHERPRVQVTAEVAFNFIWVADVRPPQEAAEALRPLAGAGAYWLFTLGLIGTGMLAVPVLAGSSAYAIIESKKPVPDRTP